MRQHSVKQGDAGHNRRDDHKIKIRLCANRSLRSRGRGSGLVAQVGAFRAEFQLRSRAPGRAGGGLHRPVSFARSAVVAGTNGCVASPVQRSNVRSAVCLPFGPEPFAT